MYFLLGILLVAMGLVMLISPELVFLLTESWKPFIVESWKCNSIDEPSKLYCISTRIGGGLFFITGLASFVCSLLGLI